MSFAAPHLPESRRAIIAYLKRCGGAATDELAAAAGITVSGARQHLVALEHDGLVLHDAERDGRGRPRFVYHLTPAADALFPRTYADLANELLTYVGDDDPAALARIFDRRGERRLADAQRRLAGLSFVAQVAELACILDEDGYLTTWEALPDGAYCIVEHNCAIFAVARTTPHACRTELAFLRAALPDAQVTRIAHMIAGGHLCAYHIVPSLHTDDAMLP